MNRQFFTLVGFEFKKIFKRKSTYFALTLVLLFTLLSIFAPLFGKAYYGEESISRYDDMINKRNTARNLAKMSNGEISEDFVAFVIEQYSIANTTENKITDAGGSYINNEAYAKYVKPYEAVVAMIGTVYAQDRFDYYAIGSLTPKDAGDFYEKRYDKIEKNITKITSSTATQKKLMSMNNQIENPLTYSYTGGYMSFHQNAYLVGLILCFAIIACIAPLFSSEYSSKTDALILSSRLGKKSQVSAKIFTGLSFTIILSVITMFLFLLTVLCVFGFDGANTNYQIVNFLSPYPITMLTSVIYITVLTIIGCVLTCGITMLFSACTKSTFSSVIPLSLILFVPAFFMVDSSIRLLYRILSLMPSKMFLPDIVFDLVLPEFFGIAFLPYQFYLLYGVIVCVVLVLIAGNRFKKHQIG